MGSHRAPNIQTYNAEGDLSAKQYHFMKAGTDPDKQVLTATANSKTRGILMNEPTDAQFAEIAMPGGGAKLKISETVVVGNFLTSTSAGQGEVADAAGEHYGAYADQAGVANDIIAVEVVVGEVEASDA